MNTQEQARILESAVHRAAIKWCGEKERETFPEDTTYFKHNWRSLPGLNQRVIDELVALSITPSPSADVETRAALEAAKDGIQAFLDMVNVIQRVQALPIPAILDTAQHNCPIIIQQIEAALTAPVSEGS